MSNAQVVATNSQPHVRPTSRRLDSSFELSGVVFHPPTDVSAADCLIAHYAPLTSVLQRVLSHWRIFTPTCEIPIAVANDEDLGSSGLLPMLVHIHLGSHQITLLQQRNRRCLCICRRIWTSRCRALFLAAFHGRTDSCLPCSHAKAPEKQKREGCMCHGYGNRNVKFSSARGFHRKA